MNYLAELIELALRHEKPAATGPLAGKLNIQRNNAPTGLQPMMYEPIAALILQGKKRTMIGDQVLELGAGEYFLGAIDVPVLWQVIQASQAEPFLSVSLSIDPAKLRAIQFETEGKPIHAFTSGFGVTQVEDELADAFRRLLRLYDRPHDIAIMTPLIEREILFRLLQGPRGSILRHLSGTDSRLSYIKEAIDWLRANYHHAIRVEELASLAGMSVSVFHRHFKAVTAMTPIQYQKQLRLYEARRLLIEQSGDTTEIAFSVGYESVSQFSREYARVFGTSPGRDARRFRSPKSKMPVPTLQ